LSQKNLSLVQPVRTVAPKFEDERDHLESSPVRWTRYWLSFEPLLHIFEAGFKELAALERPGLFRSPSAKL